MAEGQSLGRRLLLTGFGCRPPAFLPPAGYGLVHSPLVLLWHWLSPLFCEWALQRLRLELFAGKFSLSLAFFLSFLSLSLAIPQFGLLSHISCLRLSSGLSGPVLTLSTAACASLFSPHLLVADANIWATSPMGVVVRHIICVFYLFCLPSYVAL